MKKVIWVSRISLVKADALRKLGYTVLLAGTRQVIETLKIRSVPNRKE
jgi:hypothetical protein